MSKQQAIDTILRYIYILNKENIPIEKAFLYGSFARDEANTDSDIDVMLVSELFENRNDKIRGMAWRLTAEVDPRIEPYMVGTKRFLTDDYSPLLEIVRKEGIEIEI